MKKDKLNFTIKLNNSIFDENIKLYNIKNTLNFNGVSIDSRTIKPNEIFIALNGPNFNGSDFVQQAINKGASAVITETINPNITTPMIVTKNCLKTLQDIAKYCRQINKGKFIAITGSFGKTTTKDIIKESLLASDMKVHATKGNLNSNIGLPLTLANNPVDTDYSIIEAGMSKIGEINSKSQLIQPNIAVITGIGTTHGENFKTAHDIAQTKTEIFNHLNIDGVAIIGEFGKNIEIAIKIAKSHPKIKKLITYGFNKYNDIQILSLTPVNMNTMLVKVRIFNKEISYKIKILNESIAINSLAVLAIANIQKLNLTPILSAINNFLPTVRRGLISKKNILNGTITIIDETYNAGPESIVNGIKTLCNITKIKKGRRILIISDLNEFGQFESAAYNIIEQHIKNVDLIYVIGKKFKQYVSKNIKYEIFNNIQDMIKNLLAILKNNDCILVKGSRIMELDKVVDILKQYNY